MRSYTSRTYTKPVPKWVDMPDLSEYTAPAQTTLDLKDWEENNMAYLNSDSLEDSSHDSEGCEDTAESVNASEVTLRTSRRKQ